MPFCSTTKFQRLSLLNLQTLNIESNTCPFLPLRLCSAKCYHTLLGQWGFSIFNRLMVSNLSHTQYSGFSPNFSAHCSHQEICPVRRFLPQLLGIGHSFLYHVKDARLANFGFNPTRQPCTPQSFATSSESVVISFGHRKKIFHSTSLLLIIQDCSPLSPIDTVLCLFQQFPPLSVSVF